MSSVRDTALSYAHAGLCVLPAHAAEKRPAVASWKEYQQRRPTEQEIDDWFKADRPLCILAGAASGNLEMLDFDCAGERFAWWRELVEARSPGLTRKLVLERSPSGGWHVVYRCQSSVCGNIKLAERAVVVAGDQEVEFYGKRYKPRRVSDRWEVWLTLIETRGEGGIFLCAPSPGYELVQGQFEQLPVLSDEQRELLLEVAWSLNEVTKTPEPEPIPSSGDACDGRPGDDFNHRGDVRMLLRRHGWTLVRPGENEYWCRPGKSAGVSATLKDRVFYVFSSNAAPFEPDRAYGPFSVYALLEHGGDFSTAASTLRSEGYGELPIQPTPASLSIAETCQPAAPTCEDPGPVPEHLLRIPGFVAEVMDHCLDTAPYPNVVLAFAGALALQAFLAGRKVRDQADNRTNIYLLGLAYSAAGKDHPRKLNTRIIHDVGLAGALGEKFASGEAIQDALNLTPCMLFQTDEIDGMLQSINRAKDARYESAMGTLLTMYSSANSIYPIRRKASQEAPGAINQPCLIIYGTAIPNHYYEALSERMLTNGFFARMIILESPRRNPGQEPKPIDPPARVLDAARWWADRHPGAGNLENWHPTPVVVEYTREAQNVFVESRLAAEAKYAEAEAQGDAVGTTVWGRVNEQARKLALLYAISRDHKDPSIDRAAAEWAATFVVHQTLRMLFMSHNHAAANPFHAECLKFVRKLREAPDQTLPHSVLLKRMKVDSQAFQHIVHTLSLQGDIESVSVPTPGRHGVAYRLLAV